MIRRIVDGAKYSNPADRDHVVEALQVRRDTIVNDLLKIFPKENPKQALVLHDYPVRIGPYGKVDEFAFDNSRDSFQQPISRPSEKIAPVNLPEKLLSNDWNTDHLVPFRTADLPPDVTHAKGVLYYGKTVDDPNQIKAVLKDVFQNGRRSDYAGDINMTDHLRGVKKSGLFSTSPDFDISGGFAFGLREHGDKRTPGVIFVLEGRDVPGINMKAFDKYIRVHKPPGADVESAYKIETEVGLTGLDPRQIKGAWVNTENLPGGSRVKLEWVANPNYDPNWRYTSNSPRTASGHHLDTAVNVATAVPSVAPAKALEEAVTVGRTIEETATAGGKGTVHFAKSASSNVSNDLSGNVANLKDYPVHLGPRGKVDDFEFSKNIRPLQGAISKPPKEIVPIELPETILSEDHNTERLVPFQTADLPRDVKHANGILYYGKKVGDPMEINQVLKGFFQNGRRSDLKLKEINMTTHIDASVEKDGLFSTSRDFDVSGVFAFGASYGEKPPGVVFVLDGKDVPGVDLPSFNKYIRKHKPRGNDLGILLPNDESEVGLTGIDPRQVKGAWVHPYKQAMGAPVKLEWVPNPNYDPSWRYPSNSPSH